MSRETRVNLQEAEVQLGCINGENDKLFTNHQMRVKHEACPP